MKQSKKIIMKTIFQYISNPAFLAISQLLLVCIIFWQFRLTLKIGLTNPEGTAIILKAIPINKGE